MNTTAVGPTLNEAKAALQMIDPPEDMMPALEERFVACPRSEVVAEARA